MREAGLFAAEGSFGVSIRFVGDCSRYFYFVEDVLGEPALYR